VNNLLSILPPYEGRRHVVKQSQSVGDIMDGILVTHNLYKSHYDKIAAGFWKGTTIKTARAIYNFLAANTHYKVEPDERQTLRSPAAILYLGGNKNTGLDCKSYALFTAGILDALRRQGKNIDFSYRFASYKFTDKIPHHVFVVINAGTGREIWIDNVLPSFNEKKYPSYKIDKKPIMSLVSISGIGRRPKRTKAERKAKIKAAIKKRGKFLMKFNPATAGSRNAFLLLVKVNMFGLASNLLKVYKANPAKLKKFWESIGGNYKNLEKNIATGINHGKNKGKETMNGIGVLPAIAAAIAAATPLVIKAISLMKSVGINPDKLVDVGKKLVSNIVEKKIDQQADQDAASEEAQESTDEDQQSTSEEAQESTGEDQDAMSGTWPPPRRGFKQLSNRKQIGNYA